MKTKQKFHQQVKKSTQKAAGVHSSNKYIWGIKMQLRTVGEAEW